MSARNCFPNVFSPELNEFSVKGRRLCPLARDDIDFNKDPHFDIRGRPNIRPCYCCLKHVFLSRGMHHFCLETEGHLAVIVESDRLGLHFFGTPAITTKDRSVPHFILATAVIMLEIYSSQQEGATDVYILRRVGNRV